VLSAEDVERVRFGATKFREGYDQDEVDDMLDRIVATLRHDPSRRGVTADEVYTTTFSSTRFREGYDPDEVDDFLDKVIEALEEVEKSPKSRPEPVRDEPARREPPRREPPPREPARREPPRPTTTTTYHSGPAAPRGTGLDTQQNTMIRPPVQATWDDEDQGWEDDWDDTPPPRPKPMAQPPAPARPRPAPPRAPASTAHGYQAQPQPQAQPSSNMPAMPAAAIATRLQLARATLPTENRDTLVVELPDGSLHPVIDVQTGREGIVLVLG